MDVWKKISPNLDFLGKLSKNQRKAFLKTAKPKTIKVIVNFIFNLISQGHFPLPLDLIKKLTPLKNELMNVCKKTKSLKCRKKDLIKNDLLGKVLDLILPILNESLFLKKERANHE